MVYRYISISSSRYKCFRPAGTHMIILDTTDNSRFGLIRKRVHTPQLCSGLELLQGYGPAYNPYLTERMNPGALLRGSFISGRCYAICRPRVFELSNNAFRRSSVCWAAAFSANHLSYVEVTCSQFRLWADIDNSRDSWHANNIMWEGKRPSDDLNFYSLVSIVQCGMWLQDDIEKYLSRYGLSYGRFSILLSILGSEARWLNGNEVAHVVGISKATVSKMVKKLLEEGLLEIKKENSDSRENEYYISTKGKKLLDKIIPGYLERMRIIGSNITIDEKKHLLKILNKVNFIGSKYTLSQFAERPISELSKEIAELCRVGSSESIDTVMEYLNDESDIPTTKVIDYYLGTVESIEGMKRIEHYLFNGTQIQRNYCTLFFVRINDWKLVDKAYKMGLIDYIQAYSK